MSSVDRVRKLGFCCDTTPTSNSAALKSIERIVESVVIAS